MQRNLTYLEKYMETWTCGDHTDIKDRRVRIYFWLDREVVQVQGLDWLRLMLWDGDGKSLDDICERRFDDVVSQCSLAYPGSFLTIFEVAPSCLYTLKSKKSTAFK
jgi:hypothetical protein